MIDHNRIQLVGQLPRLPIPVAVGDDPFQFNLALGVGLEDLNVDVPLLGEVVNRES